MCGLDSSDEEAGVQMGDKRTPPSAASLWTGDLRQDLAAWKWTEVNPSSYSCKIDDHWDIPEVMKGLGLNGKPQSEGGDNLCHRVEHWDPKQEKGGNQVPAINQWYTVDGKEYQVHRPTTSHSSLVNTLHRLLQRTLSLALMPVAAPFTGSSLTPLCTPQAFYGTAAANPRTRPDYPISAPSPTFYGVTGTATIPMLQTSNTSS